MDKSKIITTATFLENLKKATRPMHDATEAVAASKEMRNGTLSLVTYQHLLACNLYIHQSLEKAFETTLTSLPPNAFHDFIDKKSKWIATDIALANIANKNKELQLLLPPAYDSLAALVGGLYVVEGSMLGGRFIVQLLKKNNALNNLPSFHFYRGYEQRTGQRWQRFQTLATSSLVENKEFKVAIEKAKDTFEFFQAVYKTGMR